MFGDIRIVEWLIRRIFNQVLAPEFPREHPDINWIANEAENQQERIGQVYLRNQVTTSR